MLTPSENRKSRTSDRRCLPHGGPAAPREIGRIRVNPIVAIPAIELINIGKEHAIAAKNRVIAQVADRSSLAPAPDDRVIARQAIKAIVEMLPMM